MRLKKRLENCSFIVLIFCSIIVSASFLTGCDQNTETKSAKLLPSTKEESSVPKQCPRMQQTDYCNGQGVVLSSAEAGPYTIIEAENSEGKFWIATLQVKVKPGDKIAYQNGQTMVNFYSKSLNKNFDEIIFTNSVLINGQRPSGTSEPSMVETGKMLPNMRSPHKEMHSVSTKPVVKAGSIKKVKDGYTIEELFAKKKELNGKIVKVRGKVVKFLSGIMGKNWIHIQDGTGTEGTNDIAITTQETAKKGDIIVATGKLVMDKDFGYGYFYALLMEDARIVVEK